jgi:hypothetical protein
LKRALAPLDWNFFDCPKKELPILYCYEFSRELAWIVEEVNKVRRFGNPLASYSADTTFTDWPEWPLRPYLSIPRVERLARIKTLLKRGDENTVLAWRITPLIGKERRPAQWLQRDFYLQKDEDLEVLARALRGYIYLHLIHRELLEKPRSGRATGPAAFKMRLQFLSVYRLRCKYSAEKTLEILEGAIKRQVYSDESTLERAKRTFIRYREEFSEMAHLRIGNGLWFPPFGRHFITF